MLEYKVRKEDIERATYVEVGLDNLYMAEDGSFISGTTPQFLNVSSYNNLYLQINDGVLRKCRIDTENVTRKGYVSYEKKFAVKKFYDEFDNEFDGIRYSDGKVYVVKDNKCVIDEETESDIVDGFATFVEKSYIDNDVTTIDDIEYDIEVDVSGDTTFLFSHSLFDFTDKVTTYSDVESGETWDRLTKVTIHANDPIKLKVDEISCAYPTYYVNYGSYITENEFGDYESIGQKRIYFERLSDVYKLYDLDYSDDGETGNTKTLVAKIDGEYKYTEIGDTLLEINGDEFEVHCDWVNSNYGGERLNLYVNQDATTFEVGQIINVNRLSGEPQRKYLNLLEDTFYLEYNGVTYSSSTENTHDYVRITNETNDSVEQYLVVKQGDISYYEIDGIKYFVKISGDSVTRLSAESEEYFNDAKIELLKYPYITIHDEEYNIMSGTTLMLNEDTSRFDVESNFYYVDITEIENYVLEVEYVKNNNMLRCKSKYPNVNLYPLYENYGNYEFLVIDKLFNPYNIGEDAYPEIITFYKNNAYVTLPLTFNVGTANNMLQPIMQQRDFADVAINGGINRIVDMEKDVYHPLIDDKMVGEMFFNLHFRTRNLSDWSVNGYDDELNSWNIFDYYLDDESVNKLCGSITNPNMLPSDLLYYLNFDDNDVYYQKTKLKKSFLRLLFYDSTDINTQSLLATSTIFMDYAKIYRNYCANTNPNEHDEYFFHSMINGEISEYSGVDKEPLKFVPETEVITGPNTTELIDEVNVLTFDLDGTNYRTDCSLSVSNMFDSKCSEGYYMYMFKEYSSELHERTIYMRIQFNHAGTGKIINFTLPYKDENTLYSLLDKEQREEFKEGYPINELNDKLYIPIKLKYDLEKKMFVYSLPSYLKDETNDINVNFNLFEVKIKDES